MNRKFLSVFLGIILVFSALTFVGCGKKDVVDEDLTDDVVTSSQVVTNEMTDPVSVGEKTKSDISEFDIYDYGEGYIVDGYRGEAQIIEIPSEYEGQPVVGIGERTFTSRDSIEEVYIPGSVKTIGKEAFKYCHALTKVEIEAGVETIGKEAFAYCESIESLTLNEGLVTLDEQSFTGCESIREIEIPSTVTIIDANAFSLTSIESVVIPESVKNIGLYAFDNLTLRDVTICGSATTVDSYSFGDKETEMNISFHIVEGAAAESVLKEFNLNYDFI